MTDTRRAASGRRLQSSKGAGSIKVLPSPVAVVRDINLSLINVLAPDVTLVQHRALGSSASVAAERLSGRAGGVEFASVRSRSLSIAIGDLAATVACMERDPVQGTIGPTQGSRCATDPARRLANDARTRTG